LQCLSNNDLVSRLHKNFHFEWGWWDWIKSCFLIRIHRGNQIYKFDCATFKIWTIRILFFFKFRALQYQGLKHVMTKPSKAHKFVWYCFPRYYSGDQDRLFSEAHIVSPNRTNSRPVSSNRVSISCWSVYVLSLSLRALLYKDVLVQHEIRRYHSQSFLLLIKGYRLRLHVAGFKNSSTDYLQSFL